MVPDEPGFSLDVHPWDDGGARVVAAGELDLVVAPQLRQTVTEQLAKGKVLLDLRGLEFMDSSGVAVLDGLLRLCAAEGHTLVVDPALQPPVRQILELTGMVDVLTFAGGGEDA